MVVKLVFFMALTCQLCRVSCDSEVVSPQSDREAKVFSIFSLVKFRNTPCRSTSTFVKTGSAVARNGTCFTSVECARGNGLAAGTCAAGFGVCCVFLASNDGSTINSNCTYIRNPGFPTALTTTTQVQYTVAKCSCNVCWLRLDFECFTMLGTGNTLETTGGACQDTFTVTSNSGQVTPTICGDNTGQHIYVDMGARCGDTVSLNFNFMGTATNRLWEMKASQIPCGSQFSPPNGCLQYHTDLDGRFTTFNFNPTNDNHLQNQQYSVCIRRAAGYCCIQYQVCADADSMSLSSIAAGMAQAMVDTLCTADYIGITGGTAGCNQGGRTNNNRFCGPFLNSFPTAEANVPICDCTPPFQVDIVTDAMTDEADGTTDNTLRSRGVCLEYTQIPCNQN